MFSKHTTRILFFAIAMIAVSGAAVRAQRPPFRDSLSVFISPGLVNFVLRPSGISPGSAPIAITTNWQIRRGGTTVSLFAYFSSPAAALSSAAGGRIPSSRVFGKTARRPFTPFVGVGPFSAGASLLIFAQRVRGNRRFTRTDTLDLQIDTTGLGLRPDVYRGVLYIQAQAL